MIKFQYTFRDVENRYRPITVTMIPKPSEKMSDLKVRAVKKACIERGWTMHEMIYKYGYQKCSHRMIKTDDK